MKRMGLFGWVAVLVFAVAAPACAAKMSTSVPKGWIEDFEAAKKEAAAGGKKARRGSTRRGAPADADVRRRVDERAREIR